MWSALLFAVAGAVIEVVVTLLTGSQDPFSVEQLRPTLAAFFVGAVVGWLIDLCRHLQDSAGDTVETAAELRRSTDAAMQTLLTQVDSLTRRITYQDQALDLLLSSRRHHDALSKLVQTSITDNFRYIPRVGLPDYLDFLRLAVEHADGFEGVHLRALRWYRENGIKEYHVDLRRKQMHYKRRWIILPDDQADAMEADVHDPAVLDYYWSNMGDVETYWMRKADFTRNLPKYEEPRRDMALYDREMYFSYEEDRQLLYFDVLTPASPQFQMFDQLHQIQQRGVDWIRQVPRAASGTVHHLTA